MLIDFRNLKYWNPVEVVRHKPLPGVDEKPRRELVRIGIVHFYDPIRNDLVCDATTNEILKRVKCKAEVKGHITDKIASAVPFCTDCARRGTKPKAAVPGAPGSGIPSRSEPWKVH